MYGDGVTPFNSVTTVRLRGMFPIENLQLALAKIQAKHPMLRTRILADEKGELWYTVLDQSPPIPFTVKERVFDDDWIQVSQSELGNTFDTNVGPLIRFTVIRDAKFTDLMLTIHHCMCDGGGKWALLQDVIALLDDPAKDIGHYSSLLTIEDIVPAEQRTGWPLLKARFTGAFLRGVFSLLNATTSAKNKIKPNREKYYLLHWKLPREMSAALVRTCSEKGVTVNTALTIALARVFKQVKGETAANKVTCPVEIRKYVPGITRDSIFAAGFSFTFDIPSNQAGSFWEQVQLLQPIATQKQQRLNTSMMHALEYAHSAIPRMSRFLTYAKLNYNIILSNMGRMELPEHYEKFAIETVFSPAVIAPFANPYTIITCTYKGIMDFTFVSNDDFLKYADAMAIKDAFLQLLQKELPITESIPA